LFLFAVAAPVLLSPAPAQSQSKLRPLVRDMLGNLDSLNEIGSSVALDDFSRVEGAASELAARAKRLKGFDVSVLGVGPGRQAAFNAYLDAQQHAAQAIIAAAKSQDGAAVLLASQRVVTDACLACHDSFRERENLMRTSVLFMTTFLHAWQDINRGLMTRDLELISRRAYEIQSVGRVLTWDQVIESSFAVTDPGERREFREFVSRMTMQAGRIERAAGEEKLLAAADASRRMWTDGCLACHEQFRVGE
jgi:cytochrome c556